jgi:hypothetical protein
MHVPTKLLCVKQYLCTPCAPYYVCAYRARIILVRASTHNNLSRDATIYRAHWHATVSHAVPNLPRAPVRQPFPRTLYDSNFGHFEVTFLWIFTSIAPFWSIQAQCWTEALIPNCNDPLDQPEARVRHSRATTHALMPVGNIPSHQAGTCYSREHLLFPYYGTYSSIPSSQLSNAT